LAVAQTDSAFNHAITTGIRDRVAIITALQSGLKDPISTVGGRAWNQATKRSTDLTLLLTISTGLRLVIAVVTLLSVQRVDHSISTATDLSRPLLAIAQTDDALGHTIIAGLRDRVAIITALQSGLKEPISTARSSTRCAALIVVDQIPIVALFHTFSNHPISAARSLAVVQAGVIVIQVAIITALHPCLNKAIPTIGIEALAATGVIVSRVAIITLFKLRVNHSISTAGSGAEVGTNITILSVAIITLFDALMERPISTTSSLTAVEAGISLL